MSTSIEGNGQGGPLVMNEIYEMVQKLCHETEQENRDTQRLDSKQELQNDLAGAQQMHEAADSTRTGAVVSGITLAATASAEMYFAVRASGAESEGAAKNFENDLGVAKTGEKLADILGQAYQAAAKDHEANAQTDGALSKAAGHDADQASDSVKSAHEIESSVTDSYREILHAQHDSVMATLASRS